MMSSALQRQLSDSVEYIRRQSDLQPVLGFTLGSGLSSFTRTVTDSVHIPYQSIPHFHSPSVEGHGGHLVLGRINGVAVAILQGRIHYYEGHDMSEVVFPTRALAQLGVQNLVLTNAAGGISRNMRPGELMIIKDHINLTGANPLRGPNPQFLGPRFPDMGAPYDPALQKLLKRALRKCKVRFSEGVYCGVSGPSYETAAEVRFLQKIGGHAVGMSTVAETIAARHMGLKVAGLSCITNLATGLSRQQLTHEDVKRVAEKAQQNFCAVLVEFVGLLKPLLSPS